MNSVQIHLALTHLPVILSLAGLVILIVAFFLKNTTLTNTAYVLLLVAGVAAIPVFLTGEATEEAVENLSGVSGAIIERHEEIAKLAMIAVSAAGLFALAALFSGRWQLINRVIRVVVLILAITSGGLLTQTAHLGGQIRHTEIRNGVAQQNGNDAQNEHETRGNQLEEHD